MCQSKAKLCKWQFSAYVHSKPKDPSKHCQSKLTRESQWQVLVSRLLSIPCVKLSIQAKTLMVLEITNMQSTAWPKNYSIFWMSVRLGTKSLIILPLIYHFCGKGQLKNYVDKIWSFWLPSYPPLHSAQFFTWMWQLCLSKITKSKDPIFGLSPLAQLMYFESLIPNLSLVFARIASFCLKMQFFEN